MHVAHVILPFLVTAAAVSLMMLAGVKKKSLEWRRDVRRCPSCGRDTFRDCRCRG
jgi:hypothetical protein